MSGASTTFPVSASPRPAPRRTRGTVGPRRPSPSRRRVLPPHPAIPAERVVRHVYDPETRQFARDATIVKIEKRPFTQGAMRHCFRLKKLAAPPASASNTRFHRYGWSRALNYVAKCYMRRMRIDASPEARDAVLTDITLQYEVSPGRERGTGDGARQQRLPFSCRAELTGLRPSFPRAGDALGGEVQPDGRAQENRFHP